MSSIQKLGMLACLYISQLLPVTFFSQTLPIFLRQEGMSLQGIGLLSFLSLPWTIKVLWAPLVDRYGRSRRGHYKSWILGMQGLAAIAICLCAFLDLTTQLQWMLAGIGLAITFAATQDIATDALAVTILAPSERGFGNGIQNAGGYVGGILGGGLLLLLLDRWGWTNSLLVVGVAMLLLLIPVALYREPRKVGSEALSFRWGKLWQFFQQPGMAAWIVILLLYTMGISITNTMFRPFLVDLGFSLAAIGVLYGVVAYSAGVIGALVGGLLVPSLGRKRSLVIFAAMMALATALFILPALGITNAPMLYGAAIALHLSYSMGYTALSTIMMDKSRYATAGFDYTLQVTLVFIGSLLVGGLSGFVTEAIGYLGTFMMSSAIGVGAIVFIQQTFHDTSKFSEASNATD